ncbi:MAG: protein-disulfide reductase DsbD [Gammaproteobacteria bacterium]
MPFIKPLLIFFILLSSQSSFALNDEDLLPPEKAFRVSTSASGGQILVRWEIADGYYLYRDKFRIESRTPAVKLENPVMPDGIVKNDEFFGEVEIYRGLLEVPVFIDNSGHASALKLYLQYQGCADVGVCYPPQIAELDIALPAAKPAPMDADPLNSLVGGLKLNLFEDELLPPDQAFRFFAVAVGGNKIQANWEIADGYYLYREKISLQLTEENGVQLGDYTIPRGIPKTDEAFGEVEIFYNRLEFDIPLLRQKSESQYVTLLAKFQGCADRGVCYPPMQKTVSVELPSSGVQTLPPPEATPAPLSEQDQIAGNLAKDSFWLTLASFFGFGLLLSFTPCIFPMIPILSGIIVGQGGKVTVRRGFLLSLSYVLASAATYTVFGVLAALFGGNLQAEMQQPWVIALFSGLFVLLAFSMFGFYNLELPKALQARLHNASDRHRDGTYWGAALMGSFSSLIVGPCVAAPLAGALIYIGQTGDAVLGGAALFLLGLGMGVPLLVLGASAGKLLPKAGHWLNVTKAIFGVLMLAVAVWMLERVLPGEAIMLLWAMLLIIPAIYLNAVDALPENASGWRKLWKGSGLIMLIYGTILIIGLATGNTNPLQPLRNLSLAAQTPEAELAFQRIASLEELQEELRKAGAQNKWVMLDFYADWCISCQEMESYTFNDPQVKLHLSELVVLQADVTENSITDKKLLGHFNLIGPPAILFFDTAQNEKPEMRVIGYQDAKTFLNNIRKAG